jgi:hypothetical protein
MSPARNLLEDLAIIGAMIEPAGDRLILRAGPIAIPAKLVSRVRQAKADLLATFAADNERADIPAGGELLHVGGQQGLKVKVRTIESFIIEWLNEHPAPSGPGYCAWCGKPESPSAVVLPFGNVPGTHVWLHAECWSRWHAARRRDALKALQTMGVKVRD